MAAALGIDIGSTGVRAAVLAADGRLLGHARRSLPTVVTGAGRAEQDPRAWAAAALSAGREALSGADDEEIAAVGIGALGPAPILLDASLEPLTPALLYSLDRRAEAERARLSAPDDHPLPKLLWWREHEPELWARAGVAVDAAGYLATVLAGAPAMDEVTRAAWSLPGVEPPVALPEPVEPLGLAGGLAPAAARELGLRTGTPVTAGGYKTYVDAAATGGAAALLLGSTLGVYRVMADPVDAAGLETTRYPGDGFLVGGTTTTAGSALDWARAELGADDEAAALEPGSGGLLALPYLAGERAPIWDPAATGAVLGLTLDTTRGQLRRAFLDGVALSARDVASRVDTACGRTGGWRVSGGGARDPAWLQATSDALGERLAVCRHAGEAVGPAVLGLRAVGVEPELGVEREVAPDAERAARFERLYEVYRKLHPLLAPAMARLAEAARG